MLTADGECRIGLSIGDLQLDRAGVAKLLGERYLVPGKAWRAMSTSRF